MKRHTRNLTRSVAFSLALALPAAAQEPAPAPSSPAPVALPAEWEGVWKGTTTVLSPSGHAEEVPMELHVAPAAGGPGVRTWTIVYGPEGARLTRPYEIAPVAGEPGRFVVDEKNGLFVDNQLVGATLYSLFKVSTSYVATRFEHRADRIAVEMVLFDAVEPRQSRLTGGQVEVASYRHKSIQSGVLHRVK